MNRGTLLLAAGAMVVAACAGGGYSEAQRAYDACTDSHNSERLDLEHYWAFVSGIGSSQTSCFWVWGQETVLTAVEVAMSNCRKEYASCFVYSTSQGNSEWVQRISDNGGTDGGGGGSGSELMDLMTLGLTGVQLYDAFDGARGQSYGGYSGGSDSYSGGGAAYGNGAACTEARNNAQICYNRWQSLGGGSTGQAGAEKDCYDLYSATALQVCS